MAGGIAEVYYGGVPEEWKNKAGGVLANCGCKPEDLNMVMDFGKYAAPVTVGWEDELPQGILHASNEPGEKRINI